MGRATGAWGSNERDQLGAVDVRNAYLPVLVRALDINAIDSHHTRRDLTS